MNSKCFEMNRKKAFIGFSFTVLFLGLLIYFLEVHPLIIFDADDWLYAGAFRHAIPQPGIWNPIKVFPEIITPFLTMIGAYLIMPFNGDFISSISISYGIFLSLLILGFFAFHYIYLTSKYKLGHFRGMIVLFLVVCFYFLFFATEYQGSVNFFTERDTTCVFNYTVPALINCSIVLYYLNNGLPDFFDRKKSVLSRGMQVAVCFLAIFSSIQESMILAVFLGVEIILDSVSYIREKKSLLEFLNTHVSPVLLLLIWIMSLAIESMGGRAAQSGYSICFSTVLAGINAFVSRLKTINVWCVLLVGAIVAAEVLLALFRKLSSDEYKQVCNSVCRYITYMFFTFMYCVLLCAKVEPKYMSRMGVSFGIFFWFLMVVADLLTFLVKNCGQWMIVSVIVVIFFANELFNGDRHFRDSNVPNVDSAMCAELSRNIIDMVMEADKNGENEVSIAIPKFSDTDNNFPINDDAAGNINAVLRRFRLITHNIDITFEPKEEMNYKYGMTGKIS